MASTSNPITKVKEGGFSLPPPISFRDVSHEYQFSMVQTADNLYQVVAARFDYQPSTGELGSRLMGEPPTASGTYVPGKQYQLLEFVLKENPHLLPIKSYAVEYGKALGLFAKINTQFCSCVEISNRLVVTLTVRDKDEKKHE